MERVIISSENVRPSSPTPHNLRRYKFSMLDQVVQPMLVPIVLYFPNNHKSEPAPSAITSEMLKRSLSVILTRYYPLAGRVSRDGQSIDCNDEGIPFVVAKFGGLELSRDLLRNPDHNSLRRLFPFEITQDAEYDPDSSVALIQINYFDCGSIAIGALFAHRVGDAMTIATFLNSWAAAARGSSERPVCPNYFVQSMFPHKEELSKQVHALEGILKTGKSVMRRYVFEAPAVSSLKSKSAVEGATRVEAASALIWKCFMAASLAHNVSASVATQPVNLRRKARPPFPSDCFGNFLGMAAAKRSNSSTQDDLVRELRGATSKIDDDYIERMRGDEGFLGLQENVKMVSSHLSKDADLLSFSSWCGVGLYSADFGWGKPIWVSICGSGEESNSAFVNMVLLMDTRNGDGIEAWITLDEKYMSVFDNVEELRAFASIDPSPLDI